VADGRMAQPVYPSSGNTRAFQHLRFVTQADVKSWRKDRRWRCRLCRPRRRPGWPSV